MDKTWIRATWFSDDFTNGVDQFMSFVRDRFNADDAIPCSCHNCLNQSSGVRKMCMTMSISMDGQLHILGGYTMEKLLMLRLWNM